MKYFSLILISLLVTFYSIDACTNFLITKGASVDGSNMITYAADAGGFMEPLFFLPDTDHPEGDSLEVTDWDTGKFLGKIKQVPHTYRVIGNINEWGLSIGETTFSGRSELRDSTGIIDYGSLIRITLQRTKTAREAIKFIDEITKKYGYYSSGESFSIADPNEVWLMEIIGKEVGNKGLAWVARRIPDGYISVHANQARIHELIENDPDNCLYSEDVISFAKKKMIDGKAIYTERNGKFSFADTYNPLDPGGALYCEGRVWRFYSLATPSTELRTDRFRAVKDAEPYPLYIKPESPISVEMLTHWMRDHFEGTEYDMTTGLAAGPYGLPYRWKNLSWHLESDTTKKFGWSRPICTQQSAWTFISQLRSDMPREIGNVFWYGVDDANTSCYVPLYTTLMSPPPSLSDGSITEFSWDVAFWVFNAVANRSYLQYDMISSDIKAVQSSYEKKFFAMQPSIEKAALDLYKSDPLLAAEYLADYTTSKWEKVTASWRTLWTDISVKYNDGYRNDIKVGNGRQAKGVGYDDEFLQKVVKSRPGFYDKEWRKP